MTLVFDSENHEYRYDGRPKTSVTQRITQAGLLGAGAAFYTPATAERGTAVHLACADYDLGRPVTLPEQWAGYLTSYTTWCEMTQPEWSAVEEPRYSVTYDIAGTPDRLGTMGGRDVVLDIKTGTAADWHGVQLCLYDLLCDELPPRQRRRIALYLCADGRMAQSVTFTSDHDFHQAVSLCHPPILPKGQLT